MSHVGVYLAVPSPIHRLPAGVKLVGLAAAALGSLLIRQWWHVAVVLGVVILLYAVARVPWRVALGQIAPLLWMIAAIAVFQVIVAGWERSVVVTGGLTGLIMLASLLSLTTRTSELVDVVVRAARPLRHLGVDPERVGLLVSLTTRAIPLIVTLARQVREAQIARGAAWSARAFVIPLVVRSLRQADRLAEALTARGLDD